MGNITFSYRVAYPFHIQGRTIATRRVFYPHPTASFIHPSHVRFALGEAVNRSKMLPISQPEVFSEWRISFSVIVVSLRLCT